MAADKEEVTTLLVWAVKAGDEGAKADVTARRAAKETKRTILIVCMCRFWLVKKGGRFAVLESATFRGGSYSCCGQCELRSFIL